MGSINRCYLEGLNGMIFFTKPIGRYIRHIYGIIFFCSQLSAISRAVGFVSMANNSGSSSNEEFACTIDDCDFKTKNSVGLRLENSFGSTCTSRETSAR